MTKFQYAHAYLRIGRYAPAIDIKMNYSPKGTIKAAHANANDSQAHLTRLTVVLVYKVSFFHALAVLMLMFISCLHGSFVRKEGNYP